MSKKLRLFCVMMIAAFSLLLLPACRQAAPEKADIQTTLTVDNSFSGKRIIVLTFPQSLIQTGSETETNLEKIVQKYCPNTMTPSKGYVDGKVQYSFELDFQSAHEYTAITSDIVGKTTTLSFSNPDNVMTSGWKLEENFSSDELLLGWIRKGAAEEGCSGLDFETEESSTTVSLNDDLQSSEPVISVNCLDGHPIQRIHLDTVKQKGVYDRTLIFTIAQSTFDEVPTDIKNYFSSVTDKAAASAEWLLNSNNSYDYTVKFNDVTLQELEGYTNKLLNTVYGSIDYLDKTGGSTVLAEQNSFSETLDFSGYIGNNGTNVPVEYTYSVSGTTELSECQLYENGEWHIATDHLDNNQYGRLAAVRYNGSLMKLRINDGKQYTASSIVIDSIPLEDDKLQKTITFHFDRSAGGDEASDYAQSYIESLGFGATQSVIDNDCTCTYTTSGTPDSLNEIFTQILSGKNTANCTSEGQLMTLRTMKHYHDKLDLSAIIIGKNAKTPVYYRIRTQNGDLLKSFGYSALESFEKSDLSPSEDGYVAMPLTGTDIEVSFDVTSPNIPDIIFCTVISVILVLGAVTGIFILRSRKPSSPGLGSGSTHSGLPGSKNNHLTVRKNRGVNLKK